MIEYPVSFVGLPIGNREDITRRALSVLESVDCVCCEDTRNTGSKAIAEKEYMFLDRVCGFYDIASYLVCRWLQ